MGSPGSCCPDPLLWNILWAFLGESETIPQGNMRNQEEKVPGRDLRVTVAGSKRVTETIPSCPQTGSKNSEQTKRVRVTGPRAIQTPAPDRTEKTEKSTQLSLLTPRRWKGGDSPRMVSWVHTAHSDTTSNINPPVNHPALNPGPTAAALRLQDHPCGHGG